MKLKKDRWQMMFNNREIITGGYHYDVARAVGVSLAGYRLWESKGGFPNEKNLEKLKVVLGIE